jgi:hypothetical protein
MCRVQKVNMSVVEIIMEPLSNRHKHPLELLASDVPNASSQSNAPGDTLMAENAEPIEFLSRRGLLAVEPHRFP